MPHMLQAGHLLRDVAVCDDPDKPSLRNVSLREAVGTVTAEHGHAAAEEHGPGVLCWRLHSLRQARGW